MNINSFQPRPQADSLCGWLSSNLAAPRATIGEMAQRGLHFSHDLRTESLRQAHLTLTYSISGGKPLLAAGRKNALVVAGRCDAVGALNMGLNSPEIARSCA